MVRSQKTTQGRRMESGEHDIEWLGDDDARLGPAARTALGILVAANEWSWWEDPSQAAHSLRAAVPKTGNVKWGGDRSVLEARDWLDPLRAIAIGRALIELNRHTRLRIRIFA